MPDSDPALEVARGVARDLMSAAQAVVLTGSLARGDAHRESDIDLHAIGARSGYRLERRGGYLLSLTDEAPEAVREAFHTPLAAGQAIPGWRQAIILNDPHGIAAELKEEAESWNWEIIGDDACDRAVAEEITGLAEEVHKLVVSLERGARWTAAVQRSVLALHLAGIMALHLRLLYDTENQLWDLVAARVGDTWCVAQSQALSENGESLEESSAAALTLYTLAARYAAPLLTPEQRAVVTHASALADEYAVRQSHSGDSGP